MRYLKTLALSLALAAAAGGPALAAHRLDLTPHYPIEHQTASALGDDTPQPYPMNYAEEAAQTLGVSSGKWEAFDTGSSAPLMPSLKGGVDAGGAMVRLQWRAGD